MNDVRREGGGGIVVGMLGVRWREGGGVSEGREKSLPLSSTIDEPYFSRLRELIFEALKATADDMRTLSAVRTHVKSITESSKRFAMCQRYDP